ncbi:hypothetical protein ACPUVO_06990 [Pseudocolwellia sp. HL-MZ19]|uniref:hypothetical protein n=1 Tax=unclassified Pseudocolwellia TaxID=2848178 RepID=UPI003CF02EBD
MVKMVARAHQSHHSNLIKKNKRVVNTLFIFCLICIPFSFIITSQAQANEALAVFTLTEDFNKLSKSKVRMLFRGKLKYLQGNKVELSDWPQSNSIRNEFYQELLGKDLAQMNAYWASLSFSGKARPPKEINQDSMEALLLWLSAKRFRIGYAPVSVIPKDANVLYIVEKEDL